MFFRPFDIFLASRPFIGMKDIGRSVRVCLGGTFDPFHAGHKALLAAAAEGADDIFIGITDGALAKRKDRRVASVSARGDRIDAHLRSIGFRGRLLMRPLTDGFGPAAAGDYDRIVVSPETVRGAEAINEQRRRTRLKPLEVIVVPHVVGQDLLPISATAVHAGLIDADGKRLRPIEVRVGTQNDLKVGAVRREMERVLRGAPVHVKATKARSGVPEQPKGEECILGAVARAQGAMAKGVDYAIGIEAGLVQMPGEHVEAEFQACAILDRNGKLTTGWGPGFHYPDWVRDRARAGDMVSEILGPVANDSRIGGTTGAIGWLSEGRMDRAELTRVAVLMAFVPRFRPDVYALAPPN